ncbi:PREDICTED: thyrotropin-releasing hormone-degrading ectoenzyme-like [Wasmannia auropunctata]|uniref:thyrotropin-releasing hormone-degrading ectoenzyme-like n=1 Tax=Wasmannia auropunctata TaxID=64793 RepID=UPI0005EEAA97|nr:PREDICTED: thyrotropin-releasing hormone-degrading ectoenzyme-like [Wasmannia auropunctata]
MGFLKLLLNIGGLILVTSTVFCIDHNLKIHRLPGNAIPIHYNIKLTPQLEESNFYGESNVSIEIRHVSSKISLHSSDLKINQAATKLINDIGTAYKPMKHIHDDITNILTLTFDNALSPGLYTLNMKFAGNLSDKSLKTGFMKFLNTDKEGNATLLAITQFEPNGARRVFPCWDEPALKATFDISVRHHQKYKVLSNMPIREEFLEQNSMMRTHFNITPVMSTYLVAIVISFNFVRVGNANETINIWCRPSMISQVRFAHSLIKKIVPLMVEYTNSSEKIPKTDYVVVQDYVHDGMENWGLIVYNESKSIYDRITQPTYQKIKVASLIAHEIAHQWFGNLVTPSWWSYLWLSEGLAIFVKTHILSKIYKDWRTMDFLVIQTLHDAMLLDTGFLNSVTIKLNGTFEKLQLFSHEVYEKAPVLLRMLHHTITDEVFQKGIITYLATHQFSSVTPDDLWNAMQNALDESDIPHEDYKVKEMMDTWMNQQGYPVVNVMTNETGEVTISQKCVQSIIVHNKVISCNTWWIPVSFATHSNPDFSNTVPSHWLRPDQNISLQINPDDWIILNLQQTGYYRVNYDTTNWNKIIRYLNSDNYTNIHVLNRAQIINDAFFLRLEQQMSRDQFFDLINYLSRETDYVAWYPMFQILTRLSQSKYLLLPESRVFLSHIIKLLDKLIQSVGYDEDFSDDITEQKRRDAIQWACALDHTGCRQEAALRLSQHLNSPTINNYTMLPWWQEWTYCAGMMKATEFDWNKMLKLYQKKSDKMILKSLSCVENPVIIRYYLNMTALNTSLFSDENHYFVFNAIVKNHADKPLILDYILNNFNIIKPRSVAIDTIMELILKNLHFKEAINKVKKFSETNINQDPLILSKIQKLIEDRKTELTIFSQFGP